MVFFLPGLLFTLTACHQFGPQAAAPGQLSYNKVIQYNAKQQLLLNLVRLRYGDLPYFITLDSLISQFQFESTASIDMSFFNNPLNNTYEPNIGVSYSESPTLTYAPLSGADFVKQLLTPIDIRIVYYLMQSGWGVNHVLRMTVLRLGSLENAISAARSAPSHAPKYKEFMQLGNVIRLIESQNNLFVNYDVVNGKFGIKLTFENYSSYPNEWKKQLNKIKVTAAAPYIWLSSQHKPKHPQVLEIRIRNTLGLLNYLSKGVTLPPAHIKEEIAPITKLSNGQIFNWAKLTHGLMNIKSSQVRPKNYFVAVEYEGYWFYIDQSDANSKETFNILNILISANHSSNFKKAPVFTIGN